MNELELFNKTLDKTLATQGLHLEILQDLASKYAELEQEIAVLKKEVERLKGGNDET